jgi:hypothetical protein
MPKAVITTNGGAVVTLEGSEDEVVALVRRLEAHHQPTANASARPAARKQAKTTPMGLLTELVAGGFFNKPTELGAVKRALEEKGHFYPTTTLSPLLLRLVRRRELRRIKDKKRWVYVR